MKRMVCLIVFLIIILGVFLVLPVTAKQSGGAVEGKMTEVLSDMFTADKTAIEASVDETIEEMPDMATNIFFTTILAPSNKLSFKLNSLGTGYVVEDCPNDYSGEIIIPDTYNGLPVTGIWDSAFNNCNYITSITIPDSVTSISDAFSCCGSLTAIIVDDNNTAYTDVDGVLFNKDKTELLLYPANKSDLVYTIPDGVTSIDSHSFDGCRNLMSLILPDSVKTIWDYAFDSCQRLTTITLSEGVAFLGDDWLQDCHALNKIIVDENNVFYSDVDGVVLNKDKTKLIKYPMGRADSQYVIPDGIIYIGDALSQCKTLTSVIIPDSVKTIGVGAFDGCSSLESVVIPDSVTIIGGSAFAECSSLESVVIPNSVKTIGACAFFGCSSLKSVVIPDSVKTIESSAFWGCSSLESVTIPKSVTEKGDCIFRYSESIKYVFYSGTEEEWKKLGIGYYDDSAVINNAKFHFNATDHSCEWEYDYDNNTRIGVCSVCSDKFTEEFLATEDLIFTLNGNGTSYVVSGCAKDYCGEIIVPKTYKGLPVTAIGTDAFRNCVNVTSVVIPGSVTSIGGSTFRGCKNLKTIVLPDNITSIPGAMCYGCSSLESIVIPTGVRSIGGYAFGDCSALEFAFFQGDESVWNNITIGSNNTPLIQLPIHFNSEGEHAYPTEWLIDEKPTCLDDGSKHRVCTVCQKVQHVQIIASGHSWSGDVCSVCGNETVQSPHPYENHMDENWTVFKEGADHLAITFSKETKVDVDGGWIYIYDANGDFVGEYTGSDLAGERIAVSGDTITIQLVTYGTGTGYGFSLDKIEAYYEPCSHSDTIVKYAYTPNCYDTGYTGDICCVECGILLESGESIPTFDHSIVGDFCEKCGVLLWQYYFDDKKLLLSGYSGNESNLVIPDAIYGLPVEGVADFSFVQNEQLVSVVIPGSVKSIGLAAFYLCSNLTSVVISDGVTSIGGNAFARCTSLTTIEFPDSVTSISGFGNCTSLTSVEFPDGVTSISGFSGCTSLTSIEIPDSVTSIGENTFYNCSNLSSVTIPGSVTSIGYRAFRDCEKLASVVISDGVTSIGSNAFNNCPNLTSVTIPDSVTEIGRRSFGYLMNDKIEGFIVYGKEGSAAQNYADENGFEFVTITDETENLIQGTENTQIDYENFIIRTSVQSADDIIEILGVSENATVETTPSYKCGEIEFCGTGTILSVYDGDEFIGDFTLVVEGDTNGDSVCDVIDCFEIERNSNGNGNLSGAYAVAGDANGDGSIDVADYQEIVNKILAS